MKRIKIYTVDDATLDHIVESYIDYVTNPLSIWRQEREMNITVRGFPKEPYIYNGGKGILKLPLYEDIESLPEPRRESTKISFIILIHICCSRWYANYDDNWFFLFAEALHEQFRHYNLMLNLLCKMDILQSRPVAGNRKKYTFRNPSNIIVKETPSTKIINAITHNHRIINNYKKKLRTNEIKQGIYFKLDIDDKFVESYNKNIDRLKIANKQGALTFIDSYNFAQAKKEQISKELRRDRHSKKTRLTDDDGGAHMKKCYMSALENLISHERKHIDIEAGNPDRNGRFYHIATDIPRRLRVYTNIQYTLDAKNSHLLLFNYFIINYYIHGNIGVYHTFQDDTHIYYLISQYILSHGPFSYHYSVKQLCKHLTINGIQKSIVQKLEKANIPIDVLNYMYDSSQGKVWDNLQAAFNENNRADVKQGVFSTIFYAKRTRIKDGYGQYFNSQYPTVVKIVKAYKKKLRKECSLDNLVTKEGTDAVQLSHMVTRLESCIFSRILKQLFPKKGLAVIGIHDAIAVIKDTETCNENKIRTIMLSVYRRYGLIPTIQKE